MTKDTIIEKNAISKALEAYENRIGGQYKPDARFYSKVSINQKRWGQLVRGEKCPYAFELKNLANCWDISILELL